MAEALLRQQGKEYSACFNHWHTAEHRLKVNHDARPALHALLQEALPAEELRWSVLHTCNQQKQCRAVLSIANQFAFSKPIMFFLPLSCILFVHFCDWILTKPFQPHEFIAVKWQFVKRLWLGHIHLTEASNSIPNGSSPIIPHGSGLTLFHRTLLKVLLISLLSLFCCFPCRHSSGDSAVCLA